MATGIYMLMNAGTLYLDFMTFMSISAVVIVQCWEAGVSK
jgi:hypothetical protein